MDDARVFSLIRATGTLNEDIKVTTWKGFLHDSYVYLFDEYDTVFGESILSNVHHERDGGRHIFSVWCYEEDVEKYKRILKFVVNTFFENFKNDVTFVVGVVAIKEKASNELREASIRDIDCCLTCGGEHKRVEVINNLFRCPNDAKSPDLTYVPVKKEQPSNQVDSYSLITMSVNLERSYINVLNSMGVVFGDRLYMRHSCNHIIDIKDLGRVLISYEGITVTGHVWCLVGEVEEYKAIIKSEIAKFLESNILLYKRLLEKSLGVTEII